jgi:hypothetical protein
MVNIRYVTVFSIEKYQLLIILENQASMPTLLQARSSLLAPKLTVPSQALSTWGT